jgi:hypothetical protein
MSRWLVRSKENLLSLQVYWFEMPPKTRDIRLRKQGEQLVIPNGMNARHHAVSLPAVRSTFAARSMGHRWLAC